MSTKMKTADEWRAEFYAALAADRAERKAWEAAWAAQAAEWRTRLAVWEEKYGAYYHEQERLREEQEKLKKTLGLMGEGVFRCNFAALLGRFKIPLRAEDIHTRVRKSNNSAEYDIVGVNGDTVVVAEVKARLTAKDVRALRGRLDEFRLDYREWGKRRLVGVVAGMAVNEDAAAVARKLGFIVLRLNGAEVYDHTPKGFKLRKY